MRIAYVVALVPSLLSSSLLHADQPTREQIARWIVELGDDTFAVREQASKQLWEAGAAAEAAVFEATKSADVEVSRRARALNKDWRTLGHFPSRKVIEGSPFYVAVDLAAGRDYFNRIAISHLRVASAEQCVVDKQNHDCANDSD